MQNRGFEHVMLMGYIGDFIKNSELKPADQFLSLLSGFGTAISFILDRFDGLSKDDKIEILQTTFDAIKLLVNLEDRA